MIISTDPNSVAAPFVDPNNGGFLVAAVSGQYIYPDGTVSTVGPPAPSPEIQQERQLILSQGYAIVLYTLLTSDGSIALLASGQPEYGAQYFYTSVNAPPSPTSIPISTAQTTMVNGNSVLIPQTIPPVSTVSNIPSYVSQMYELTPGISNWNINYDVGSITNTSMTYTIQNITTNTDISVFFQLPSFIISNMGNNFIVPKNSSQIFTLQFVPDNNLLESSNSYIQIVVSPINNSPVQLIH